MYRQIFLRPCAALTLLAIASQIQGASIVVDPIGDSFNYGGWGFPKTPDLISASVAIENGNAAFSVRVAAGTFPSIDTSTGRGTTFISFFLDMDQNPATGGNMTNPPSDTQFIGWERRLKFSTASEFALLSGSTFRNDTQVSVSRIPEGFDALVPLDLLGGDATFNFKLHTYVLLATEPVYTTTVIVDTLPDKGLPGGSAVPEPTSATYLTICGCLAGWSTRRR